MTKKYNLSKILFISIFSIILLMSGFAFTCHGISFAEEESLVEVKVTSRANSNQEATPISTQIVNGFNIVSYNWNEASKFTLSFGGSDVLARSDELGSYYEISLQVEYLKGYIGSSFNFISEDKIVNDNVFSQKYYDTSSKKGYQNFSYTLSIDNNNLNGISGWGIYRFTLDINGTKYPSLVYYIVPNTESIKPEFSVTKQGSKTSMHDEYVCKITNISDFRYSDVSKITWHVEGHSNDGTAYALTKADQLNNPNCQRYFYESIDRNGLEFTFNDKDIAGEWQIFCTFSPTDRVSDTSEPITIRSGFHFNELAFTISIVSVVLVATGVFVLVQYLKAKKEKVW